MDSVTWLPQVSCLGARAQGPPAHPPAAVNPCGSSSTPRSASWSCTQPDNALSRVVPVVTQLSVFRSTMTSTPVYSPTTASKPQLSCFRVPSEHLDKRRFGIKLCEVVSLEPRRSFCCCYKRGGPPERGPPTHHTQRAGLWTSPAPSSHWTPCRKFQRGSGTAACPL